MSAVKTGFTVAGAFVAGAALMVCAAMCTPDVPVTPAAPVVNEDAAFPDVTLTACAQEDSDNCYWDAAAMGNGEGRSFVTLHGVTYYPDVPVEDFGSQLPRVTLNGESWRYVDGTDAILYCDQPFQVGIDTDDSGNQWAGCM